MALGGVISINPNSRWVLNRSAAQRTVGNETVLYRGAPFHNGRSQQIYFEHSRRTESRDEGALCSNWSVITISGMLDLRDSRVESFDNRTEASGRISASMRYFFFAEPQNDPSFQETADSIIKVARLVRGGSWEEFERDTAVFGFEYKLEQRNDLLAHSIRRNAFDALGELAGTLGELMRGWGS